MPSNVQQRWLVVSAQKNSAQRFSLATLLMGPLGMCSAFRAIGMTTRTRKRYHGQSLVIHHFFVLADGFVIHSNKLKDLGTHPRLGMTVCQFSIKKISSRATKVAGGSVPSRRLFGPPPRLTNSRTFNFRLGDPT